MNFESANKTQQTHKYWIEELINTAAITLGTLCADTIAMARQAHEHMSTSKLLMCSTQKMENESDD